MKKVVIAICFLLVLSGCVSGQRYVEGTHITLGAYVPVEDRLYGVELMSFTSGIYLTTTNNCLKCEREHCATNSYLWGMVETKEWSRTKIESLENDDGLE